MSEQRHYAIDVEQQGSRGTSLIGEQAQVFQVEGDLYYHTTESRSQTALSAVSDPSPIPEPGILLDREHDLQNLALFFQESGWKILILEGLGGIGKTVLAANACRAFGREFQDIYWGSCRRKAQLETFVNELDGMLLRHHPEEARKTSTLQERTFQERIHRILQRLSQRRYLLVFDDMHVLLDRNGRIRDKGLDSFFHGLIQAGHQSKLLFISRQRVVFFRQPAGIESKMRLRGLTFSGTTRLLEALGMSLSREHLRVVHQRVGGHPLALRILAELYERGFDPERLLKEPFQELDRACQELCDDLFKELRESMTLAEQDILQGLSTYRRAVPLDAIEIFSPFRSCSQDDTLGTTMLEGILRFLYENCLIERKKRGRQIHFYRVPGLIRDVMFKSLTKSRQQTQHLKAAQYWIVEENAEKPLTIEGFQEQTEAIYHSFEAGEVEQAAQLTLSLAEYLCRYGLGNLAQKLLAETQASLLSEHDQASRFNQLGNIHRLQGNYPEAIQCYLKAREIWEIVGESEGLAVAENNLGAIYAARGEYTQAVRNYARANAIFVRLGLLPELATSYNNLGYVHACLCEFMLALKYHEKAREIQQKLGLEADLASSYNNIGFLYDSQQEYELALEYYERACAIRERLGLEMDLAESFNNIGGVYRAQERYESALRYYQNARDILERLGLEVNLARCYNNIGLVYTEQGQETTALDYYNQAEGIQRRLGLEVDLAKTYNNLGVLYANQDDKSLFDLALRYYEQAREIQERLDLDVYLAVTLSNMGQIFYQQQEYRKAKHAVQLAIAIRKKMKEWDLQNDVALLEQIEERLHAPEPQTDIATRIREYVSHYWKKEEQEL